MWRQRARQNWFQGGDRNTKNFDAKASHRQSKNHIDGIFYVNGVWHEKEAKIANIFMEYYTGLFSSSQPVEFEELIQAVQLKVSTGMNADLAHEFHEGEVRKALKQMYPLKAPGLDGMSPLFYQHFWSTCGHVICKTVLDFLNHGISPHNFNQTHVVFVPKVKEPKYVTDFRPISLCNVIYKIASKAIANRLKRILPSIISDSLSAFVHGRLIIDNVLVAFETMHHISKKEGEGKVGEMALKLDMSKAYDRMGWCCLEKIMEKLDFVERWRCLVMKCVTSVTYAIRVNGSPMGCITPTRAICQGDPLLPYLCLLCAEGLSSLIKASMANGVMKGISVYREGPELFHLFFCR